MSTKPISPDIRQWVLDTVRGGVSIREAAAQCGVSVGSATRWAKAAGVKGRPAPIRHGQEKRAAVLRALADGLSPHEAAKKFETPVARIRFWQKNAESAV